MRDIVKEIVARLDESRVALEAAHAMCDRIVARGPLAADETAAIDEAATKLARVVTRRVPS